jgi:tRNA pseudouridine55 synthase
MEAYKQESPQYVARDRLDESGVLIIDKPAGITSMDVIRVIRRITGARRIGHGGTLDPFATGVLPILINQATRLSSKVMDGVKEYVGTFLLGVSYDTQDMTGKPLHEDLPLPEGFSEVRLYELSGEFVGEIEQLPPMYSAVKRNGRPLYDYARAGEQVSVEPRKVFVESFKIGRRLDERRFEFAVRCAKGTYVRTLVHDLGQKLGCGAVVESLTRTQTGAFHIDEAVQLSTLKYVSDIRSHLKAINEI